MSILESHTLVLFDRTGAPFGHLRLSPRAPGEVKGDCILDITPHTPQQAGRSEVRWLFKRCYRRGGELKFRVGGDGVLTASHQSFSLVLHPRDEGGFAVRPPSPPVTADWQSPPQT